MDKCSYFIENKAIFGSFPTQDEVNKLEAMGVRFFVNLTLPSEPKIVQYSTKYKTISYPIHDKCIPKDYVGFCRFVYGLCKILQGLDNDEKMYIHCKGGHGRSGIVVAVLLAVYHNISAEKALDMTRKCHQNRLIMRDKWRKIGAPQTNRQREFVCKLLEPLDIDSVDWITNFDSPDFSHQLLHTYFRPLVSTKSTETSTFLTNLRNEYLS